MANKIRKLILVTLLSLLLSGCWDFEDINKRSITLSIGVEEMDEQIIFNGEIAKLASESNKGGTSATVTDVYYYTTKGKDFEEAKYDFDYKIPNTDFTSAVRCVALSKQYAQKAGIESYINRFSFMPGFRSSVLVVISEQNTKELFEEKVTNDISTGHGIENTIKYLEKNGYAEYTTVQDIRQDISFEDIGFVLPYIKKENDTIKYLGLAVMKDSKFIGVINADESIGTLYLTTKNASGIEKIPISQNKSNLASIKTKLNRRKIKTRCENGQIYIDIKLNINSNLLYEYIEEPIADEAIKKLESIIQDMIKQEVSSSIKRSQEEFRCDIFGFARYFKADNPKLYKTINWAEEYPDVQFNVEVKSKIINYNLINTKAGKNNKGGED